MNIARNTLLPLEKAALQAAFRALALNACMAVLYVLALKASVALTPVAAEGDHRLWLPFWLPAGLALAGTLRFGAAALPGILVGAAFARISLGGGGAMLWLIALDTLQPWIGALLIRRLCRLEDPFSQVRGVFLFLFATVAVTLLSISPLMVLGRILFGDLPMSRFPAETLRWALNDMIAIVLLTPLVYLALLPKHGHRVRIDAEGILVIALAIVMPSTLIGEVLLPESLAGLPLAFLVFPLVTWAALRHSLVLSSVVVLLVTVVATISTASGAGPFDAGTAQTSMLLVQCFIAALAMTGLLLCASSSELKGYQSQLAETLRSLDALVRARTAALDNANRRLALEASAQERNARINHGRSEALSRLTLGDPLEGILSELERQLNEEGPGWKARIALSSGCAADPDLQPGSVLLVEPVLGSNGARLADVRVQIPEIRHLHAEQRDLLRETAQLVGVIVEHKHNEEKLRRLARHDSLTGILNRGAFLTDLDKALSGAAEVGHGLALFYIDIDGFKAVNDTYGHAEGDRLLVAITRAMEELAGEGALLGRVGGDEFVVAIPRLDSRQLASLLAGRLVDCCSAPEVAPADTPVAGSVGIACYPQDGSTGEELIAAADAAMYGAKHAGGRRYMFAQASGRPPPAEKSQFAV